MSKPRATSDSLSATVPAGGLNSVRETAPAFRPNLMAFAIACALVLVGFSVPLYRWFRFGFENDLFSYILLVPFISGYLIWTSKEKSTGGQPAWLLAALSIAGSAGILAAFWVLQNSNPALAPSTQVALTTIAFVLAVIAVCAIFLGKRFLQSTDFPLLFLIFMAPLPASWKEGFESFLQHGSAEASYLLFKVCGTTMFRQGLIFQFPNITIEVAPECSGIRSTLVLFLTSLVAGHLFLRNPLNKVILTAVVIPLGIFRNMLRIFTISELCMHVSPDMIDSPIHHRGGPIFFAISLIPLFILMWYLRKRERQAKPTTV